VEAQADRWSGAVAIADLLQLEQFPPADNAPAVVPPPGGPESLQPRDPNAGPPPMPEPVARPMPIPLPAP